MTLGRTCLEGGYFERWLITMRLSRKRVQPCTGHVIVYTVTLLYTRASPRVINNSGRSFTVISLLPSAFKPLKLAAFDLEARPLKCFDFV